MNSTIYQDIKKQMISFMKERKMEELTTVRTIISSIKEYAMDKRVADVDLSNQEVETILFKEVKKREETIEEFKKGDRQDLIDKEQAEIALIKPYLPKMLSEEDTKAEVKKCVEECGISTMQEMGKVMGELKKKFGNTIDLGIASKIIKELLS